MGRCRKGTLIIPSVYTYCSANGQKSIYKDSVVVFTIKVESVSPRLEEVKERNILEMAISPVGLPVIDGKWIIKKELKSLLKKFITNNGVDPELSESPQDAVVYLYVLQGVSRIKYEISLEAIEDIYVELRAEFLGITIEEYLEISKNRNEPKNEVLYKKAEDAFPMEIILYR